MIPRHKNIDFINIVLLCSAYTVNPSNNATPKAERMNNNHNFWGHVDNNKIPLCNYCNKNENKNLIYHYCYY